MINVYNYPGHGYDQDYDNLYICVFVHVYKYVLYGYFMAFSTQRQINVFHYHGMLRGQTQRNKNLIISLFNLTLIALDWDEIDLRWSDFFLPGAVIRSRNINVNLTP